MEHERIVNARALKQHVSVVPTPPPCEREFSLSLRPNGDLRWICIDGVYYSAKKLKTSGRLYDGDRHVRIVDVVVQTP